MIRSSDMTPATIAGHPIEVRDRAGAVLTLRIGLGGASILALAQAISRLDGVRVTGGQGGAGRERGYLVHCQGFQMVLSAMVEEGAGADSSAVVALALVSRAPPAALAVTSDLACLLELLMIEPPTLIEVAPREGASDRRAGEARPGGFASARTSSPLRSSALKPGKPLARKTPLRRKTPLSRGRFR